MNSAAAPCRRRDARRNPKLQIPRSKSQGILGTWTLGLGIWDLFRRRRHLRCHRLTLRDDECCNRLARHVPFVDSLVHLACVDEERFARLVRHRRLALIVERDGALEYVNHRGPRMRVPPLAATDRYFDGDEHRFKAWR